jgi:CRP-like cAMP-binding protein
MGSRLRPQHRYRVRASDPVALVRCAYACEGWLHRADAAVAPHGRPIVPKLSQAALAEIVGTTRGRVNFFMNKFRKLGFIDYNGGIKIRPALLSVVLHG